MFLYAAQGAEWVKASDGHTVGLILATFVAPLEFLATVVAFLARDTMSAAALPRRQVCGTRSMGTADP